MNREGYACEIRNLKNRVSDKAREVIGKGKGAIWWYGKIVEFSDRIKILEEEYITCMSYHILIGSTEGGEEISPIIDFFEISSVKNFCLLILSQLEKGDYHD